MPFEEFTKNRPIKDTPTISILKQGLIGISQVCYNKYFKNYEYIILMFDKENKVIGLKPTNEAKSNAYKIHPKRDGRLVQISGMAFLKYYNIPHDETKVYTCEWNEEEKLIEVKI